MAQTNRTAQEESRVRWNALKGRVITSFGSINAAAERLDCHAESIRLAGLGKCPKVLKRLEAELTRRERLAPVAAP